MTSSGRRYTEEYMVRLDKETNISLREFALKLGLPPTTLARKLIQFGLKNKTEFRKNLVP